MVINLRTDAHKTAKTKKLLSPLIVQLTVTAWVHPAVNLLLLHSKVLHGQSDHLRTFPKVLKSVSKCTKTLSSSNRPRRFSCNLVVARSRDYHFQSFSRLGRIGKGSRIALSGKIGENFFNRPLLAFFLYFSSFQQLTVKICSNKILPMTGFEPPSSGVGSDCSTD